MDLNYFKTCYFGRGFNYPLFWRDILKYLPKNMALLVQKLPLGGGGEGYKGHSTAL